MTTLTEPATLAERDLAVLWHPCAQMHDYRVFPPLPVVAAEGAYLHLDDGRKLLDCFSSWWCKSLGHRHPAVAAAIADQLDRFEHVVLANTTNEPVVRLCETVLHRANNPDHHLQDKPGQSEAPPRVSPPHFTKVFLADNGSTAVEVALKMALQAQHQLGRTQRTHFIALENAYHGETTGCLSVTDLPLYAAPYDPIRFPCTFLKGLPYRSGPSDPRWLDASDEWPAIEAQLAPLADTAAAVIVEPVMQGAGGMLLYSPDLLARLRQWCDAHDVYLIADEIAAGTYRLGTFLAWHLATSDAAPSITKSPNHQTAKSLLPDFACLSKGLTAGTLPLSAVLTTQPIYDVFEAEYHTYRAFMHSNTYTGNALAVAAANAALGVYTDEAIPARVDRLTTELAGRLQDVADRINAARLRIACRKVRGLGGMTALNLVQADRSPLPAEDRTGYAVYRKAVERGALLRPLGDSLYLFPPLNTPDADLDRMAEIMHDAIHDVA
ncbi:MAG: aminotransferase class III-fold pyridoxal phosphate-dependent enzyme [Planctomycetota bacterium]